MISRREEVVKLIAEIRENKSLEQIASELEVSYSTAYAWSRGSRKPSNLARKALKRMAEKEKNFLDK